jgi:hypothetical protein
LESVAKWRRWPQWTKKFGSFSSFQGGELTRDSLSKTVVNFLWQGKVIRAVPDPRAVVEPEYFVDPIAIAGLHNKYQSALSPFFAVSAQKGE